MDLRSFHNIYFIGIGGIGMSAIARYLHQLGKKVSGYDKTSTTLTKKLESEGIDIHYEDDPQLIDKDAELVIYTPAIPGDHKEMDWLISNGYHIIKRSEALGMISRDSKAIAVAGTHGKTSTSSLVTQILKYGNIPFSAFVGGIILDSDTNYISMGNEWVVLEADEYDRSFLHLNPQIAILMSMDADHLDIYKDHELMKQGFWQFITRINPGGMLIYKDGLERNFPHDWKSQLGEKKVSTCSFGIESGEVKANNIRVEQGKFVFDVTGEDFHLGELRLGMPGKHNVENCIAAIVASLETGLGKECISTALSEFKGVHRRFEELYNESGLVYIDDYAHHPTELNAVINAVRDLYPDRKITGIFQPHLYSRTRDFVEGFADALDRLDEVILMEIYPARERPIKGVTSNLIISFMKKSDVVLVKDDKVVEELEKRNLEVVMTLGAGDIDLQRSKIKTWLKNRQK